MNEPAGMNRSMSRRRFLQGSAAVGAALTLPSGLDWAVGAATQTPLRRPGSLPNPHRPPGTDLLPQIEHIIVVMQENHSYDNYLGMLHRGDGFTLGRDGVPTHTNLDATGNPVRAFPMPNACQGHGPSQSWNNSHRAYNGGRNDGFASASGPVAMGYWTATDIPFYYSLAKTFPLCDRWFSSVLAQTYPNRRFLLAGTAYGNVSTDVVADILSPSPPNGTIMDQLDAHQIPWLDYYASVPSVGLFKGPRDANRDKLVSINQFFTDAAAGTLPGFSLVEPVFVQQSEEDPQDIQAGERFVSQVVQAAMHGPGWDKTLLVWTYDEGGGYYDHVPPPAAVKPDDIPPGIHVPPDLPGQYDRYGFRVPAAIVSPYARRNYVSHVVHDHTSILKLIETKWNLPALTFRDANADNLLDSLDLHHPAFRDPPNLAAPGLTTNPSACTPGNPGVIPPPGATTSPATKPHAS